MQTWCIEWNRGQLLDLAVSPPSLFCICDQTEPIVAMGQPEPDVFVLGAKHRVVRVYESHDLPGNRNGLQDGSDVACVIAHRDQVSRAARSHRQAAWGGSVEREPPLDTPRRRL